MSNFETITCSRCGGTGKHSWCERFWDVCFKCGGKGKHHTKRGAAARAWFDEQRTIPASEIKVGDVLYIRGIYTRVKIAEIEGPVVSSWRISDDGTRTPLPSIRFTSVKGSRFGLSPDTKVIRFLSREENGALIARALAYQDTLTQKGTPRKAK